MDGVASRVNGYVWSDLDVFSNPDFSDIENGEVVVCEKVFAYLDVVSLVAEKGRLDIDIISALAENVFDEPVFLFGIAGFKIIVFEYLLFVFKTFFAQAVEPCFIRKICEHSFFVIHIAS